MVQKRYTFSSQTNLSFVSGLSYALEASLWVTTHAWNIVFSLVDHTHIEYPLYEQCWASFGEYKNYRYTILAYPTPPVIQTFTLEINDI